MSAFARNWCIARGSVAGGANVVVYTVPQGFSLILKDVNYYVYGSPAGEIDLYIVTGTTGYLQYLVVQPTPTTGPHDVPVWIVLNQGDALGVRSVGYSVNYWFSGALLDTGGQTPPA